MKLRALRFSGEDLRGCRDAVLRALSLVITDRRWAAPLSAMALGFGLFLGVAIGPGAAGTLATGAGGVIAVAAPEDEEAPDAVEAAAPEATSFDPEPGPAPVEPEPFEPALAEPSFVPAPLAEPAPEPEAPPAEEPAPEESAEEGESRELKGTVVHANPAAGSYTMAIAGGELVAVHAPKLPLPGEALTVAAVPLLNSTFAEEEREMSGSTEQASVRGVVTHVDADPVAPAYTLSGRGSSIRVHLAPSPAPQLPTLGTYATVRAAIQKPAPEATPSPESVPSEPAPAATCVPDPSLPPIAEPERILVQRSIETEPEPATYVDLAGFVTGLCPATKQLLISADDLRTAGDDILLTVAGRIETTELEIGDSVVATADLEADGSLILAGLASDEGRKGAEDASSAQGDLKR